jgi:hypothetical protein
MVENRGNGERRFDKIERANATREYIHKAGIEKRRCNSKRTPAELTTLRSLKSKKVYKNRKLSLTKRLGIFLDSQFREDSTPCTEPVLPDHIIHRWNQVESGLYRRGLLWEIASAFDSSCASKGWATPYVDLCSAPAFGGCVTNDPTPRRSCWKVGFGFEKAKSLKPAVGRKLVTLAFVDGNKSGE